MMIMYKFEAEDRRLKEDLEMDRETMAWKHWIAEPFVSWRLEGIYEIEQVVIVWLMRV